MVMGDMLLVVVEVGRDGLKGVVLGRGMSRLGGEVVKMRWEDIVAAAADGGDGISVR